MPKNTIRLYLLLTMVRRLGASFTFATYVMFLISRGLNLFEVNLVNFVFFTTLFLCEIPTGVVADVFGRKPSYVISCFLTSLAMFIYAVSGSVFGFAVAEATAAIGMTFASGAFQAWLVDGLKHKNYNEPLGPIFAKEQQYAHIAEILGAIVGAFLADKNPMFPWMVSGTIALFVGFLAWGLMKEEYFVRQRFSLRNGFQSMKEIAATSIRYIAKNKVVKFILLLVGIQFFAIQAANMQWQPFFSGFLPNKTALGFIFGAISVSLIVASALSSRFLKIMKDEKRALIVSQVGAGAGIIATVMFKWFPLALGIFLLHEFARGLFRPLKDTYLNDNIPSKERATLISFESMAQHIGGMFGLLFSGFFAEYASIKATWMLSGGILIAATLWLARNGKSKEK